MYCPASNGTSTAVRPSTHAHTQAAAQLHLHVRFDRLAVLFVTCKYGLSCAKKADEISCPSIALKRDI